MGKDGQHSNSKIMLNSYSIHTSVSTALTKMLLYIIIKDFYQFC